MGVDGRCDQRALRYAAAALFASSFWLGPAARALAEPALGAAPASAPVPSIALSWRAPEGAVGCLGAEGLARAVNEYLGREAFSPTPAELTLEVRVERRPEHGWRALLQIEDLTGAVLGERELLSDAPLCASLDEPLKLAVALMVDSELVASASPEEPPSAPASAEPDEAFAPEASQPSTPWILSVDASALIETGLLPSVSPGLELGVELSPAAWLSLRASGVAFLPAEVALASAARAKISLLYGNLSLCPRAAPAANLTLSACLGLDVGTLFAKTSQLELARSTRRRVFLASFAVRGSARLSRKVSLLAQISALAPYQPERFVYELNGQRREFFQMSAPSLVAGIGSSVMF